MFTRVLIANRGEVAVRIVRSCHQLGFDAVAVYSDADRNALHTRVADIAVHIGGAEAADSYLSLDRIIAAARATDADAIHPGFGFLAENATFAQACADAGIIFVGPSPEVIRVLGTKRGAAHIADAAGVALIPGYRGSEQSDEAFCRAADAIGYPVLVKPSSGGGGKGMEVVRAPKDLPRALALARRIGTSAFGDDTLILESYIDNPRHIEVQVLADHHGNAVHIGERECSLQRRHQKVIEECPSPSVDDDTRAKLGNAALALVRQVDYTSAGTVEFIMDSKGDFYFLEVNTRLQVEHPITEEVYGIDIVGEQLRIAQGKSLSVHQQQLVPVGSAIECRVYAEVPEAGFLPATGTLIDWHVDMSAGIRVDSGVDIGSRVTVDYDPMLAKIIAHGSTRSEARLRLMRALRSLRSPGVATNATFLRRVIEHEHFINAQCGTHFIADYQTDLIPAGIDTPALQLAAVAATVADYQHRAAARTHLPSVPAGFSNTGIRWESATYMASGHDVTVRYRLNKDCSLVVEVNGHRITATRGGTEGCRVWTELEGGIQHSCWVHRDDHSHYVWTRFGSMRLDELPRFPIPGKQSLAGGCTAPMPGKVLRVLVAEGDPVEAGQTLVILEAMKMEHSVCAPHAGTIVSLCVEAGRQVEARETLVVVDPADSIT